jgi:hypothetical protein
VGNFAGEGFEEIASAYISWAKWESIGLGEPSISSLDCLAQAATIPDKLHPSQAEWR